MKIDTILLITIGGLWYLDKGSSFLEYMRKEQFKKDGSEVPFVPKIIIFLFWPLIKIPASIIWPAEKL